MNDSIPIQHKIKFILSDTNLSRLGFKKNEIDSLQRFYKKRNFAPLWINDSTLSESGIALQVTIQNSLFFGVPNKRLRLATNINRLNWVEKEVCLTAQTAFLIGDLNKGFLIPGEQVFKDRTLYKLDSISFFKTKFFNSCDSMFLNQGVSDSNYRELADQLYHFCRNFPIDKTIFNVCSENKDTLKAITESKKALISKGYLSPQNENDDEAFKKALFLFQEHNGLTKQKFISDYTAKCLNESTYNKVVRASYALERLRWQIKRPKKYIHVNIPSYSLSFYHDDTLRAVHKIIVGKVETPTPTLSSKIYQIVSLPYWTVPQSIAKNEILPAVQANVGYLQNNNFKIYGKSGEVNPYNVNWSKIKGGFPYKLIQQPGKSNSLGIIKFEFHNKFGVYLHDTPNKKLFNKDIRAFSHGCMRCQNPLDLARKILDFDSIPNKRNYFTQDSLDTLINLSKHQELKLVSAIPIYVEYISVTVGEEFPIFHFDIYQKEDEIISFLTN